MDKLQGLEATKGGFTFDLCARNEWFNQKGMQLPKTKKTGTTIVGIICQGAVILGADTRATEDTIVCDKNCEKIHYIAPNIYCCGAGTSADCENSTGLISSQLELHRLSTGRQSRVVTCLTMLKRMLFRYQGHVSAALIVGGVDVTGPHLYTIYPHGSTDQLPFVTMGSGSLAAMAVFEAGYRDDLTIEQGKLLVQSAVRAGIFNDLGSGSNVDLCVITKDGVDYLRNHETPNARKFRRAQPYVFAPGTTPVLLEKVIVHQEVETH
jgi:20S proteasome subunit beta 2